MVFNSSITKHIFVYYILFSQFGILTLVHIKYIRNINNDFMIVKYFKIKIKRKLKRIRKYETDHYASNSCKFLKFVNLHKI